MAEDNAAGLSIERFFENYFGIDDSTCDATYAHRFDFSDTVISVEHDDFKDFMTEIFHSSIDTIIGICTTRDFWFLFDLGLLASAAEF